MPVAQNLILLVFTRYSFPGRAWERRSGGSASKFHGITRSQAEPGNADPEALPPILMESLQGRARVKSLPRLLLGTS
ncbi:hypothetical protein [Microcoleus sp.]|uniref:hypothetical protein n=1 Tax=Microcoleus sp. TaxID=44472 RepID=UPI00403ECE40